MCCERVNGLQVGGRPPPQPLSAVLACHARQLVEQRHGIGAAGVQPHDRIKRRCVTRESLDGVLRLCHDTRSAQPQPRLLEQPHMQRRWRAAHTAKRRGRAPSAQVQMVAPNSSCAAVIGRGGGQIQEIQRNTGATIKATPAGARILAFCPRSE